MVLFCIPDSTLGSRCSYLLCMIITAFLDICYLGSNELLGATVITNLFSAIPYFGHNIVNWLWGGFAIDNPTLTRFYSYTTLCLCHTWTVGIHLIYYI